MKQILSPELKNGVQMNEYYKLELSQVVERINSLENIRLQLGIFFGTANLTVLGTAMYSHKAGVLFVAAAIMLVFLFLDRRFRALHVAYFYRGLQLQKRFATYDEDTFLKTLPGEIATEARRIAKMENLQDRKTKLSTFSTPFRSIFFRLSSLVIIGEVVVGILLWLVFNWDLA